MQGIINSNEKILQRLSQGIEIELLLPAIDYFTLYKFSQIKPNTENTSHKKIGDIKNKYLELFSNEINKLPKINRTNDVKRRFNLKIIITTLNNLLLSTNFIVLFISWTVSLSIIFILIAKIMLALLKTNFDSTIIAALLSAIFLGSITISISINSKKGN